MTPAPGAPLVATAGPWQLRCHFHALGDRVGHRVGAVDPGGRSIDLLESIEVDALDTDWPPSPPLQDLSVEPIEGTLTALAVGRAGRSHWSSSIQAVSGREAALLFDLACRCESQPGRLGSTYRCLIGLRFVEGALRLEGARVEFQVASPQTTIVAQEAVCRIERDPRDASDARQTVSWKYAIVLKPAAAEKTTG